MNKKSLAVAVAALLSTPMAFAYETGDVIVRGGAIVVDPQESSSAVWADGKDSGGKVGVDSSNVQLGLTGTYMFADHWGVGLLLATPFEHELKARDSLSGLGHLADVKQLPPTVTLQYFFNHPSSNWQPYVGAGINYTTFFDEDFSGANKQTFHGLNVKDSVGYAFQAGLDYDFGNNWNVNAAVWYLDIDTNATFQDTANTEYKVNVSIDPMVYMLGVGYKF